MFHFAKQNKYKLLQPYSDDKSVDEVLLSREERTSSSSTEDVPPYYKIPSKTPYRLSCGLNIVLLCSVIALLVATWSELVIKYGDKFNNGLLKRVRQPCTSPNHNYSPCKLPVVLLLTSPDPPNSPNPGPNPYPHHHGPPQRLSPPQPPAQHIPPRPQPCRRRGLAAYRQHQPDPVELR